MIDKVIIAEDYESSNLSVRKTIEDLKIKQSDYVYYCDDAYNKIQLANQKGEPYELLITDLYFEDDGAFQKIDSGFKLIQAVRTIQPDIRVLVFSGEDKPAIIDKLYKEYEIDGYVRKARHDIRELKLAFEAMLNRQQYYSPSFFQLVRKSNAYIFTDFDMIIIRLMSQGYRQKEIESYLKKNNIEPNSLSMIEKKLKEIRDEFKFSTNQQIVLHCKEAGLL